MSTENTITRRNLLKTGGPAGLAAVAGCLEPDNNGQTETEDDTPETTDAPEPDTLQGNPIIYHGETYDIDGTEYTVPSSLDRGPQTVQVGGEEIDAYISNQEFHETAIANQFTGNDGLPIQEDHHYPEEINVEGDTIELRTKTETPREDMGDEIANLNAVYTSALNEDGIPYNFELKITDGDGETYEGSVGSNTAQEFINEEINTLEVYNELSSKM